MAKKKPNPDTEDEPKKPRKKRPSQRNAKGETLAQSTARRSSPEGVAARLAKVTAKLGAKAGRFATATGRGARAIFKRTVGRFAKANTAAERSIKGSGGKAP